MQQPAAKFSTFQRDVAAIIPSGGKEPVTRSAVFRLGTE
jgi:hypothetical protein